MRKPTLGGPGDGPEVKKQRWVEVSQQFLSEAVGILLQLRVQHTSQRASLLFSHDSVRTVENAPKR